MNITRRARMFVAVALVGVTTLAIGGAVALAAPPPYDPDPDAYGTLTFYDTAANVITSGDGSNPESIKYAVASTNPTSPVTIKSAAIYLYTPVAGTPSGTWTGSQMSGSTRYPITTAPAPVSSSTFPAAATAPAATSLKDAAASTPQLTSGPLANVYQVRLKNFNLPDYASASITIDPTTSAWQQIFPTLASVPTAPTGAVATPGNAQALVSWTAPASNGGAPITSYLVTPFIGVAPQTPTTVGNVSSASVTNLTNGTAYTFKVRGVNKVGPGPDSEASMAVTPAPVVPAAPGTPIATAGISRALVRWTAPSATGGAAITGYAVTAIKAGVAQRPVVVGNVLTTPVVGLTNGSSYKFTVHATNRAGAGRESAASAAVTPLIPTKVVMTSAPTLSTFGTAIMVVGKLTRTDTGAAVAGQAVQLQARKKGSTGAYRTVATVTSTTVGVVKPTTFKPVYAVELRLVRPVVVSNGFGTSVSPSRFVLCQMRITANLSALSVPLGRSVTLSGVVAPNHKAKTIYLQRKRGTSWVNVSSKVLTTTSGYGFAIKPTGKGTLYYRVMMKADSTFVVSYGVAKPLKVN